MPPREDIGRPGGPTPDVSLRLGGASWLSPFQCCGTARTIPRLPGKLTFWRRRAVAGLAAVAVGVGLWVALADGTAVKTVTAGDLATRRLAGQRLVTGFEGRHPPRAVKRMIRDGRVAGVILFSDNLGSRDHARRLIRRLQAIHRPKGLRDPLLVMIDQEGGLVKRLPGAPRPPHRRWAGEAPITAAARVLARPAT